jgi:hypothetical protein
LFTGLERALDVRPPVRGERAGAGVEERLRNHGGRVETRPGGVKGCESQVEGTETTIYSFQRNANRSSRNQ